MDENTINQLTDKELKGVKLLVFDVDGILVPRGTKIKESGERLVIHTKTIAEAQLQQIKYLAQKGFLINISSGRGLYMLQKMFWKVLPFVSLTYENGSGSWIGGKLYQHVNSFSHLDKVYSELLKVKDRNIKGFEPKELIITIHCKKRVKKIERVVDRYKNLYYIWNGEAYDIGIKNKQTKKAGLIELIKILGLNRNQVLFLGDNCNDASIAEFAKIVVSADKTSLKGNFYVPLSYNPLASDVLMRRIIEIIE